MKQALICMALWGDADQRFLRQNLFLFEGIGLLQEF